MAFSNDMSIVVKEYSSIRNGKVISNGKLLFDFQEGSFDQFSESVYRKSEIQYPKFHKMDHLSKLGFLAADILLKNSNLKISDDPYKTGVILSNANSSLDTDVKYYSMVKNGVASPSVFVYSLPNIAIGEICIRHGIKGESTFFISPQYDISSQVNYINQLLENEVLNTCICGWLELTGQHYEAFLYLATSDDSGSQPHTVDTIKKLYLQS